jgi:hypothetical protein
MGLEFVRQVLYHLSRSTSPYILIISKVRSCFMPEQAWTASPHSRDDRCEPPQLFWIHIFFIDVKKSVCGVSVAAPGLNVQCWLIDESGLAFL